MSNDVAGQGPALSDGLGLADLAKACANHCREGLWQPNIMQNEQGVRLNAAMLLEQCAAEIQRLRAERDAAIADLEAHAEAEVRRAVAAERERLCAAIKAADDKASEGDYMLDSDDCISVICGTWNPGA